MSDPNTGQDPYDDGDVPADADLTQEGDGAGGESLDAAPGPDNLPDDPAAPRLDEADVPLEEADVRPDGETALP